MKKFQWFRIAVGFSLFFSLFLFFGAKSLHADSICSNPTCNTDYYCDNGTCVCSSQSLCGNNCDNGNGVLCSDGTCVSDVADCGAGHGCPQEAPCYDSGSGTCCAADPNGSIGCSLGCGGSTGGGTCTGDSDCTGGARCVNGGCTTACTVTCNNNSDCGTDEWCDDPGACGAYCVSNFEHSVCEGSSCRTYSGPGDMDCGSDADCAPSPTCVNDGTCHSGETCNLCPVDCGACIVNGACQNPPNGNIYVTAPTGTLCSSGIASPSTLSGSGPWSWQCTSPNGGTTASCSASVPNQPTPTLPLPRTSCQAQEAPPKFTRLLPMPIIVM